MKVSQKHTAMKIVSLMLAILLASTNLVGCSANTPTQANTCTFFALDTVITLTINDNNKADLLDSAKELVCSYESLFSATLQESDIYRLNHADGEWVTVSDETITLLQKAIDYCQSSEGLIDITILPVKNLWDFTGKDPHIPSSDSLSDALSHVDYRCIEINKNSVRLTDPEAMVDLGFIAKGYITDKLWQYLVEHDVQSALLQLGGNIMAIGTKPDGSAYKVGIQKPFAETGTPITSVDIAYDNMSKTKYCSVVTSGIYERYFEQDNHIYHHIIDPRTGYPIDNELASVTILSNSATDSDALSTLCLSLGVDEATKLIENLYDIEAIFITRDNQILHIYGKPDA